MAHFPELELVTRGEHIYAGNLNFRCFRSRVVSDIFKLPSVAFLPPTFHPPDSGKVLFFGPSTLSFQYATLYGCRVRVLIMVPVWCANAIASMSAFSYSFLPSIILIQYPYCTSKSASLIIATIVHLALDCTSRVRWPHILHVFWDLVHYISTTLIATLAILFRLGPRRTSGIALRLQLM